MHKSNDGHVSGASREAMSTLHPDIAATALLLQAMAERTRELIVRGDSATDRAEIERAMRQLVDVARCHARAIGEAHLEAYLRMTDELDGRPPY